MSLWNKRKIEKVLEQKLKTEFDAHEGEEYFSNYVRARQMLLEDLLPEIKANEPNLSDHGPDHIADVLNKAYDLLGDEIDSMKAIELYTLCISILFHDVGNFHGRKKHNIKIAEIYDKVRNKQHKFSTERSAVLAIAGAHTGFSKDGDDDTLKNLSINGVYEQPVNFQPLAALLRFADELAEGPQRTSVFMQEFNKYSEDSLPYHRLANVTHYTIDRANERIQINYPIRVEIDESGTLTDGQIPLIDLLKLINKRIIKVNEERQYCRFYCSYLKAFQEISVTFDFIHNSEYLELGLAPLVLNDLIIPGQTDLNICEPNHSSDNIYKKIQSAIKINLAEESINGI